MIGASRVTRSRTNALILFFDQLLTGKIFIFIVAPIFLSCFFMQALGKRFDKAVS